MDTSIENVEKCLLYNNAEERDVIKQYFTNPKEIDKTKKTIVFSTPSETGTSFFRIFEPMRVMWKHFRDEVNFVYTENMQPNHMKLADLIIQHRAGNLHSHFLSVSKMWPKTEVRPLIVHDVDDNEFNLPKTHPMRDIWYMSGKDKMSIQSLKESDIITTTTEKLRKTFSQLRTGSKNVHIFRNAFDWELPQWNLDKKKIRDEMLPEWKDAEDPIIIGWAGLTSHFEDIKRMHGIIKAIHDKYPNTYFVLAGMALKDTAVEIHHGDDGEKQFKEKEIENEDMLYRNRVIKVYSDIDKDRIKIFNALPLEEYAKFNTLFDIALAYVEHNTFNACKSEIKVIEAMHYKIPTVFSYYGGYKDYWDNVPENLKSHNGIKFPVAIQGTMPKKWVEAIEFWIDTIQNKPDVMKKFNELVTYTDNAYDLNELTEERLFFYLNLIEEFNESEVNRIAKEYGGGYF